MKNLQEYAGIDATRLERMERRLKEDVLAEAGARPRARGRKRSPAAGVAAAGGPEQRRCRCPPNIAPSPRAAAAYGGRILVARESAISGGGSGELIDTWEPVAGAADVQTPAEVYRKLRGEGFRVSYARVPVTDGRAPAPEDIDVIIERVRRPWAAERALPPRGPPAAARARARAAPAAAARRP